MINKTRHAPSKLKPDDIVDAVKRTPGLIPRTPRVVFRAILGVLLFFCGILLGVWLIIRFRRDGQDGVPPS